MTDELELEVAEALQQDISYGRIRLDGVVRGILGISPGDTIELQGNQVSHAICWRSHSEDDGKALGRIDNLTRKNLGVAVGDTFKIRRVSVSLANSVTLHPAIDPSHEIQFGDGIDMLAKRGLLKRVVTVGDKLVVPNIALFGNALPFMVVHVEPANVGIVGEDTVFRIKDETPTLKVTRDDVQLLVNSIYSDLASLQEKITRLAKIAEE